MTAETALTTGAAAPIEAEASTRYWTRAEGIGCIRSGSSGTSTGAIEVIFVWVGTPAGAACSLDPLPHPQATIQAAPKAAQRRGSGGRLFTPAPREQVANALQRRS